MRSSLLRLSLKLALAIIIFSLLLWKVPVEKMLSYIKQADFKLFLVAWGIYLGGQVLSSYKWSLLASSLGLCRPFKDFVAFYFIGMFFNLFMPGSIGGDVYRTALLAGTDKSRLTAAYSVLAERYTGGMALLSFALISAFFYFKDLIPFSIKFLVATLFSIAWFMAFAFPWLTNGFPLLRKATKRFKLDQLEVYWQNPLRLFLVLFLSFSFQTVNILSVFLIAQSVKIKADLLLYFFVVPIVDLLSTLPVSLSGLGIREGGLVFFLKFFGVDPTQGLACSLMLLSMLLLSGALGGLVYSFTDYPILLRVRGHRKP